MVARSVEASTFKECFEFAHYLRDARDLLSGDRFENSGQIGEVFSVLRRDALRVLGGGMDQVRDLLAAKEQCEGVALSAREYAALAQDCGVFGLRVVLGEGERSFGLNLRFEG